MYRLNSGLWTEPGLEFGLDREHASFHEYQGLKFPSRALDMIYESHDSHVLNPDPYGVCT